MPPCSTLRISKSEPVPGPNWHNVTKRPSIDICTNLIRNSTSASNINDNADPDAFESDIQMHRTMLWLYVNDAPPQMVTIVFHALGGGTDSQPKRCPRFCVCAGIDALIDDDTACSLLDQAVDQFVRINGTSRKNVYVWTVDGIRPMPGDRIYPIFQRVTTKDTSDTPDGTPHNYTNVRWPPNQTTWQLK
jgi:hypothetical protein